MTILSGTIQAVSTLPGVGLAPTSTVNLVTLDTVSAGLTATPSGTQATSLLLTSKANSVTTVATAADGVRLPPALPGMAIKVRNGATNSMDVWPSSAAQGGVTGGDSINALSANAAYAQVTGTVTFTCYVIGVWETA
jgi:hypothetical protein